MSIAILWFRRDLRLTDNDALIAAVADGRRVLPLYVHDELPLGGASQWWLHHSLAALGREIRTRGGTLLLRRGDPARVIDELIRDTGASAVYCGRRFEPEARRQESRVAARLGSRAILTICDHSLLRRPSDIATQTGRNYKVFTPYYKASLALGEPAAPRPVPGSLEFVPVAADCEPLTRWSLLPTAPDWAGGLRETWRPGESGANERLDAIATTIDGYAAGRDRPDLEATSRLSPHLHFGEISPRQVWHGIAHTARQGRFEDAAEAFIRQLYWRDFSSYLLFHYPLLASQPLRREYERFPWREDGAALARWRQGRTGYPIVDAGMRQLWHTGWMHNRVRMIAASLLVKHLLIPWQRGAEWFMDTLVDADLANNAAGWQWVAGSGSDAAPYFRVFNPISQGQKFDPDGEYVRRWIPELRELPKQYLHEPWTADAATLDKSGVTLDADYPTPIVEHKLGRERALAAYRAMRDR